MNWQLGLSMAAIYLVFSEFLLQIEINNPTTHKSFRFMLYFTVIIYLVDYRMKLAT